MTENGDFYYGEDKIHYEVVRKEAKNKSSSDKLVTDKTKPRKPRKVVIKVHSDQRVVAAAPNDASDETQFYLGRRYVLKVITNAETNDVTNSTVKLSRGKLTVELSQSDSELDAEERAALVKSLIDKWYQDKAKLIFAERLDAVLPKAAWVTDTPAFRLLAMKKQWGSCSTRGNLILNPHLVKAPKECIDYVILHELCHIAEHNHSEYFWRLLTQVMPNWKEVKARLDGMAELYLNE